MKKLSSLRYFPAFLLIASLICLTSCATKDKKGGADGSEDIYDSAELPERDDSVDPSNANFSTLSNYTVYFGTDSFTIAPDERGKLEKIANWMEENPQERIIIAGHCDDRGTTQYNLALGERRALAMREYMIGLGVSKKRIFTVSYGEERPSVSGDNENAWVKNRRAQAGVLR